MAKKDLKTGTTDKQDGANETTGPIGQNGPIGDAGSHGADLPKSKAPSETGFPSALAAIKTGSKVSRKAWDNAESFLSLEYHEELPSITSTNVNGDSHHHYSPTQEDLFADDWFVV